MLFSRVGAAIARDNKSTPANCLACSTAMVVTCNDLMIVGHAKSSLMMLPVMMASLMMGQI